jgi:MFS family permease
VATVTSPSRPDPGRPALTAVFTATFFVRFGFGITVAVFASYIAQRSAGLSGSDVGTAGVVSALAPIGEFSTVLFSGVAADRWGRFPVLFGGMGAAAALFVAIAATRAVLALGAANLLFGVASGAILAASLAVVADRAAVDSRGHEMGRFDAMNLFGWIAGYAFGLGLGGALPNRELYVAFLAGAAVISVGLLASALLVSGRVADVRRSSFDFGHIVRTAFRRTVLVVTLPWLAIYSLLGTALVFLGTAAVGVGISPTYLAVAIVVGGSLLVVSQPYFGRLADRSGRTRMMTVGATGFVLVLLAASLLIRFGVVVPVLAGLVVGVALALAYGPAALAALADLAVAEGRATTMAIYSLTISLGMFLGLVASSELYGHFGPSGLYPYFGAIALTIVVLTAIRWSEARRATIPVR